MALQGFPHVLIGSADLCFSRSRCEQMCFSRLRNSCLFVNSTVFACATSLQEGRFLLPSQGPEIRVA